jgi:general secretion pathway protein F
MDALLNTFVGLLGPLMILFMGAMVLLIVLAMLLPIFQLNELVK